MLPYTSKFYCNGTIFDSIGSTNETYLCMFARDRDLYFLRNNTGFVERYNIDSEQIEVVNASKQSIYTAVNSIVVDADGNAHCFEGHGAKILNSTDVLYIKDNFLLMSEKMDHSSSTILLETRSEIRDFIVDADGGYIVLHNTHQVTKFSAERVVQYTTKLAASSYALSDIMELSASPELLSVDCVHEYTSAGKVNYPVVSGYHLL